jgi:hypothetical protein
VESRKICVSHSIQLFFLLFIHTQEITSPTKRGRGLGEGGEGEAELDPLPEGTLAR